MDSQTLNSTCPCGTGELYKNCCQPFHKGSKKPETAEQLMRSRFSAYHYKDIEYIYDTTAPDYRKNTLKEDISSWANITIFTHLNVLYSIAGTKKDKTGQVKFIAFYISNGIPGQIHELSNFIKLKGKWYYTDGEMPA